MSSFFQYLLSLGAGGSGGITAPYSFLNLSGLGDSNMEEMAVTTRWLTGAATQLSVTEVNGGISASLLCNNTINSVPPGIGRWQNYTRANGKYVVAMGTNDLNNGISLSLFTSTYTTLINQLLFYYAPANIILCSIPYTALAGYASWTLQRHLDFNAAISTLATTKGTKFCDFYTATYQQYSYYVGDNLHFNQTGHTALKNTFIASL